MKRTVTTIIAATLLSNRKFSLPLPSLGAALQALRKCEAEILRQCGLDPQEFARIKTPVWPSEPNPQWITHNVYPAEALRRGEQGLVTFRLSIDAKGGVQNCTVTQSSGSNALDDATCKLMRRPACFNPARDEAGVAVPSIWVNCSICTLR